MQRERVSCCRKVWLFSPCRLFTFVDSAYLGPSCMVGMPYINSDILQALSLARACRASRVALVNTPRVRFSSEFVQLKYSTKWLVYECLHCDRLIDLQFLTYWAQAVNLRTFSALIMRDILQFCLYILIYVINGHASPLNHVYNYVHLIQQICLFFLLLFQLKLIVYADFKY